MIDQNARKFNAKCVVRRRIFINMNTKLRQCYLELKILIVFLICRRYNRY